MVSDQVKTDKGIHHEGLSDLHECLHPATLRQQPHKGYLKRINNVLVPMRSVFTMAFKEGIIRDNVMARVDNLRIEEPAINPLSMDEILKVLECVHPHYRNCLTILFFTELRFGEMAALKWKNVHLDRKTAKIC